MLSNSVAYVTRRGWTATNATSSPRSGAATQCAASCRAIGSSMRSRIDAAPLQQADDGRAERHLVFDLRAQQERLKRPPLTAGEARAAVVRDDGHRRLVQAHAFS